ncbi:hypothetical protein AURDEDRAFT_165646 [Auricularia subglabra TFB-10046 SS5]|nr:hypothetical protein AURDEDRAFT_165646 [Auricularia subglabra TFB-10046 SS5]
MVFLGMDDASESRLMFFHSYRDLIASSGEPITGFSDGVLWDSKPLVQVLREQQMINEDVFTMYIDHPKLAPGVPSVIIYGDVFDTSLLEDEMPRIPGPDGWTVIPVTPRVGHWQLFLDRILLHRAGTAKPTPIRVARNVIVDSGASMTYLPGGSMKQINVLFKSLGAQVVGNTPEFKFDDKVELQFGKNAQYSITGQAKRFFSSANLGEDGATRNACVETSGSVFILGLNFFMTFILSFQDAEIGARLAVLAHEFV